LKDKKEEQEQGKRVGWVGFEWCLLIFVAHTHTNLILFFSRQRVVDKNRN